MNVLHISESALRGGGDISMARTVAGLARVGVTARRLVGEAPSAPIEGVSVVPPMRLFDRFGFHAWNLAGLNFAGMGGMMRVSEHPWFKEADLIHFHNLHGGYFNYRWLPALARSKPLVWTLHDQWALTGHCAYSFDCEKWKTGCGTCPYPKTYPAIRRDATHLEWTIKSRAIVNARPWLICPSQWLFSEVEQHPALVSCPRFHIPYGVDTSTFCPLPRQDARRLLGWPSDRRVILFAAQRLNNMFKNPGMLFDVIRRLSSETRARLALACMGQGTVPSDLGVPVVSQGYVTDDAEKARWFSAADLFVFPTRADNLPLVVQEAQACGCPVVTVPVGGLPEMVQPMVTGWVAHANTTESLLKSVEEALSDDVRLAAMRTSCREVAVSRYSLDAHVSAIQRVYLQRKDSHVPA